MDDEWLLRWPGGVVDVYHWHGWVASFFTEDAARQWVTEQGGVLSN